jgi:hypothetical protein
LPFTRGCKQPPYDSDAGLSLGAVSFRRPGVLCLRVSDSGVQAAGRRFYRGAKDAERAVIFSAWEIESPHAEREEYVVGPPWAVRHPRAGVRRKRGAKS